MRSLILPMCPDTHRVLFSPPIVQFFFLPVSWNSCDHPHCPSKPDSLGLLLVDRTPGWESWCEAQDFDSVSLPLLFCVWILGTNFCRFLCFFLDCSLAISCDFRVLMRMRCLCPPLCHFVSRLYSLYQGHFGSTYEACFGALHDE